MKIKKMQKRQKTEYQLKDRLKKMSEKEKKGKNADETLEIIKKNS